MNVRRFWRNHSLLIVLLGLWFAMVVATRLMVVWWPNIATGEAPVWAWWAWESIMSNEADIFGAFLLVYLTKKLNEKGSPESGDEDMG